MEQNCYLCDKSIINNRYRLEKSQYFDPTFSVDIPLKLSELEIHQICDECNKTLNRKCDFCTDNRIVYCPNIFERKNKKEFSCDTCKKYIHKDKGGGYRLCSYHRINTSTMDNLNEKMTILHNSGCYLCNRIKAFFKEKRKKQINSKPKISLGNRGVRKK